MGMYTELIFGAELVKETPPKVIEVLKYLHEFELEKEEPKELPDHEFFKCERWRLLFKMGSFYFGIHNGDSKFWYEDICNSWHISTRSNIKNYDGEIEKFLDWIKPYISQGTGEREFYAIVTYEESSEPTIYYLVGEDNA